MAHAEKKEQTAYTLTMNEEEAEHLMRVLNSYTLIGEGVDDDIDIVLYEAMKNLLEYEDGVEENFSGRMELL